MEVELFRNFVVVSICAANTHGRRLTSLSFGEELLVTMLQHAKPGHRDVAIFALGRAHPAVFEMLWQPLVSVHCGTSLWNRVHNGSDMLY
jgi:hypothetical protein